jgi:hypothetical protein
LGSPQFTLHSQTGDVPSSKLCDFRNPRQVQHHTPWSIGAPPVPFPAPDCADIILMPRTYYWIVMGGTNYRPSGMDSNAESSYESGWRIGDFALTKTTGDWVSESDSKSIPIRVWLSER